MSQALASLSRKLISTFVVITLSACNGSYTAFESDVDFDTDIKTADIEQDNAELITLGVYQSAFLGHYQSAAYLFLDASDLPEDADLAPDDSELVGGFDKTKQFKRICDNGGTALYRYTKNSGEVHKVGDRISVSYKNCFDEEMKEFNGTMTGTYSKIKGLNDRFVNFTSNQCMAKLQANLSLNTSNVDSYEYDADQELYVRNDSDSVSPGEEINTQYSGVISIPADDIKFTRVANKVRADILNYSYVDIGDGETALITDIALSIIVASNHSIVFILKTKDSNDSQLASVDGDQFYTLIDLENEKQNCQGFERTLTVQFNDFSTTKTDYVQTMLSGSVSLLESQETTNRVNQSIVNSNFSTTVTQGKSTEIYSMKDYNIEKAVNISEGTYSYLFNGYISNAKTLGGLIRVMPTNRLLGNSQSLYPKAGIFEIEGKGLERIYAAPNILKLTLSVDYNGDSTGNGFGDYDVTINTSWAELFAREFKE